MNKSGLFAALCLGGLALSSVAVAQQAPVLPRVGTSAVVYFQKGASEEDRATIINALETALLDGKNGLRHRQFSVFRLGDRILVRSLDTRRGQFSLGVSQAKPDEGSNDSPITPAFILEGLSTHLMVGVNLGDPAQVKSRPASREGSTLLNPGANTKAVNFILTDVTGGPDNQDVNKKAIELQTKLNENSEVRTAATHALAGRSDDESEIQVERVTVSTQSLARYMRASLANYSFQNLDANENVLGQAAGSVVALSAGLQMVFESFDIAGASIQVGAALGVTTRFVWGDVTKSNNSGLYRSMFGTGANAFYGPELTLFAKAGDVVPYARLTYLMPGKLDGFSGAQVTIGVDLFPKLFGNSK